MMTVKNQKSIWFTNEEVEEKPSRLKKLSDKGFYKFIRRSLKQVNQEYD